MSQALIVHYDPKLVEESVFHALTSHPRAAEFDRERQAIYEIAAFDRREQAFQKLYANWFERLALGAPIIEAIDEQPLIAPAIEAAYIVRAVHAKQEGAELYVGEHRNEAGARRTLRITLKPQSLLDRAMLQPFLRHELFHIADMLDGDFGYAPNLPKSPDGPTYDNFIVNRYRALWDISIDGRMARRGWRPPAERAKSYSEFVAAFPMFGAAGEPLFDKLYDEDRPHHAELVSLAFDPMTVATDSNTQATQASHCPLCKFPTHAFEPAAQTLPDDVREAIRGDFPAWVPELGLCIQCADLYRGRQMSMAALRTLPGWHPTAS